jgi:phage terminase large subunit-like protein
MLQFGLQAGAGAARRWSPRRRGRCRCLKRLLADPLTALSRMSTPTTPRIFRPRSCRTHHRALWRHAARPAGARRRADRGSARRALSARRDRGGARGARARAGGRRIVVAIDPPASSRERTPAASSPRASTPTAFGYVLADESAPRAARRMGERAIALYRRLQADRSSSRSTRAATWCPRGDPRGRSASVPVRDVRAMRGKWLRAEPVAALRAGPGQARRRVSGARRRDVRSIRLDGLSRGGRRTGWMRLVWAVTALMLSHEGVPRVRGL